MATERILISVTEKGALVVTRNIKGIGTEAKTTSPLVDKLKTALIGLGGIIVARKLLEMADSVNTMRNRLAVAETTTTRASIAFEKLFEVAQKSRTSFEATTNLYARLAISTEGLAGTQDDLLNIVELVNKSIISSGTNAIEAKAGLIQLTQGLAAGAIRGDEFRSVSEQLIGVMQVLQQETGLTRGALRELAFEGGLTAELFLTAFKNQEAFVDAQFGKTIITLGQAYTILHNAMLKYIGDTDKATSITRVLADSMAFVGKHLEVVLDLALVVGAGLLVAFGGPLLLSGIVAVTAAMQTLILTFAFGGFAALGPALLGFWPVLLGLIAAASVAILVFKDDIAFTSDGAASFGDVMSATFSTISTDIENMVLVLRAEFAQVFDTFEHDTEKAAEDVASIFGISSAEDFTRFLARQFDLKTLGLLSMEDTLNRVLRTAKDLHEQELIAEQNEIKLKNLETAAAKSTTALTKLLGELSSVRDAENKLANATDVLNTAITFGQIPMITASKNLEKLKGQLEGQLNPMFEINRELDREIELRGLSAVQQEVQIRLWKEEDRLKKEGVEGYKALAESLRVVITASEQFVASSAAREKALEAEVQRADVLASLIGQIDSVAAAEMQLAEARRILGPLMRGSNEDIERAIDLYSLLRIQLRDQIDPLDAITREFQRQNILRGLTAREQEAQIKLWELEDKLMLIFGEDAKALAETYRDLITTNLDLIASDKERIAQDKLDAQIRGQLITQFTRDLALLARQQEILTELQVGGVFTMEQYNRALLTLDITAKQFETTIGAGLSRGFDQLTLDIENVSLAAEDILVNAFNSASDAITNFVLTGEADIRAFALSVLEDIARMITQMLLLKAIQSTLGFVGFETGGVTPVTPMASGGITNGPELFPMGGGNVGLRGEAGREAILPLTGSANPLVGGRLPDGSTTDVPLTRLMGGNLGIDLTSFFENARMDSTRSFRTGGIIGPAESPSTLRSISSGTASGSTTVVTFAPSLTIQTQGSSGNEQQDQQQIDDMMRAAREEFGRMQESFMMDFIVEQSRPGNVLNPAGRSI